MTDYLSAEAGIRRLHARYADAVFRKDFATFADCFTEDAEWRLGGYVLRGRQAAVDFLQERIAESHWVLMTFRNPILDIGHGTATGRTYVTEINAYKNAPPGHTVATYYERFAEQNGVWRRAWALFHLHYMGKEDFSGTFFAPPDYGPPPAMPPVDA
jgi:ketosteroid isomerase-like protein